jgi:hypothetical protein
MTAWRNICEIDTESIEHLDGDTLTYADQTVSVRRRFLVRDVARGVHRDPPLYSLRPRDEKKPRLRGAGASVTLSLLAQTLASYRGGVRRPAVVTHGRPCRNARGRECRGGLARPGPLGVGGRLRCSGS